MLLLTLLVLRSLACGFPGSRCICSAECTGRSLGRGWGESGIGGNLRISGLNVSSLLRVCELLRATVVNGGGLSYSLFEGLP